MSTSVYPKFQQLLERVKLRSEENAKAHDGTKEQRRWMDPPNWNGNPLDIQGLTEPFARDQPNREYEDELNKDEGRIGVCMGRKIEIDYMSIMERAFRARSMTSVRGQAHAATMRQSHGESKGVHIGVVLQYTQDILQSGQA